MKIQISKNDIVYVDMDGVLVENNVSKEEFQIKRLEKGFFLNNNPVEGAVESFIKLSENCSSYILSTPVWDNIYCWSEKRIWVEKYLGESAKKKLILTHDKSLNMLKVLIDDSLAHGADKFVGKHIHFGSEMFPTWNEVLNSLKFVR